MEHPAPVRGARSRRQRALQGIYWEELKGVASSSGCADPDAEFVFFAKTAYVASGTLRRLKELESHLLDPYELKLGRIPFSMRIPFSEAHTPEVLQKLKAAYLSVSSRSSGLRLFGFDSWEDSLSWDTGESDQEDVIYEPDFPTLLDPRASAWVVEVIHFASYLKDEFAAQVATRRFQTLVEKQRARVEQVLHEVGFSSEVEDYVRRVCIWSSLIRAAAWSPQRYADILLERLGRLSAVACISAAALPKVRVAQAGTYQRWHERCLAAIRELGFRAGAAYFEEIDRQCESLVGLLLAQRLDDLNEGTALTPALFQDMQQGAIENAYAQLAGLTCMQRFSYEVKRYESVRDDFLKEATLGLSSCTEGLTYKVFLVEQRQDSPSFGALIQQLQGLCLSRRQSRFLRSIKNEGNRCRHNRDHTVSRERLDDLRQLALDFVSGLRGLTFETKCPECNQPDVIQVEKILDSPSGADTVHRKCGHPVYSPRVTITALHRHSMDALGKAIQDVFQRRFPRR